MLSESFFIIRNLSFRTVLILVVMEYALGGMSSMSRTYLKGVLILVVMEYALGGSLI